MQIAYPQLRLLVVISLKSNNELSTWCTFNKLDLLPGKKVIG